VRFRYLSYNGGLVRPVMPLRVAVANQWVDASVLVDSGADITILDAELAEDLGLTLEDGAHAVIRGATGHDQDVYFHQVQLTVGPISYGARVAFTRRAEPYGLAGQLGLFDQFHISFDRRAEEFELRPYETH
jgi:Aspartyl protease